MNESEAFFEWQEDAAHRIAAVIGAASAAHSALSNLQKRREAGEDAVIWRDGRKWVVGPRPADAIEMNKRTPS